LQYANKGYKTRKYDFKNLNFPQQNDSTVYNPNFPIGEGLAEWTYNYHYLNIPIKINFQFGKGKIHFFSSAGLVLNFLVATDYNYSFKLFSGRTESGTKSLKPYSTDFNKVNLSPMISAGIDCALTKHLSLRIEPTFRFGVIKLRNTPVADYLYNAGLNSSFYWRF